MTDDPTDEATDAVAGGGLAAFNALSSSDSRDLLLACAHAPAWADAVAARRPFDSTEALIADASALLRGADAADIARALAGHPRIGDRGVGGASRSEQAGALNADEQVSIALARGNADYEERFGRVYLVRAAGRSGAELLALLRERLGNDDAVEDQVMRGELAEITALRLRSRLEALAAGAEPSAPDGSTPLSPEEAV